MMLDPIKVQETFTKTKMAFWNALLEIDDNFTAIRFALYDEFSGMRTNHRHVFAVFGYLPDDLIAEAMVKGFDNMHIREWTRYVVEHNRSQIKELLDKL